MKNIFENAYFGKPYKTSNGEKAILLEWKMEIGGTNYYDFAIKHAKGDGYDIKTLPDFDIVSEWEEPINEEELNELANVASHEVVNDIYKNFGFQTAAQVVDYLNNLFKAGYRRAKKE